MINYSENRKAFFSIVSSGISVIISLKKERIKVGGGEGGRIYRSYYINTGKSLSRMAQRDLRDNKKEIFKESETTAATNYGSGGTCCKAVIYLH